MTTRAEALAQQKRRDKAATEARTLRCGGCRRAFDRALVSTMSSPCGKYQRHLCAPCKSDPHALPWGKKTRPVR